MYVNDIPDIVKSHVWIFADDTKLFASTDQTNTLQEDLNNLMKWAELWELTFNVIKCKVIHYGQNNPESDYIMNNNKLESVDEECDLGVNFTKDLKFSQHIASQGCNLLRLRKNNFPECVFGLNIIFELFPFVDITLTSYYISINFNFIFLNLIENTLSRTKSAVVHLIGHNILSQTVWTHNQVINPEEQKNTIL